MVDRRSLWLLLPHPLRALPADLVGALILTALVNIAVFIPIVRETPLRVPLGLAFVLFIPGYVFIAALFPEAGESPTAEDGESVPVENDSADTESDASRFTSLHTGIDGIERVALAFGLSIAIVPLIGLALNFTPWGIRLTPIMISVTGFTLIATVIAAIRRWKLPEEDRFRVPYREWIQAGRNELFNPESQVDKVLNVLLVLSIVLAIGTVTFAIVVPPEGEQFSAVYILTEDDDGELVADGYPTEFIQGESEEIVLGVDNHEHRTVDYTVVAVEQETETIVNESTTNESAVNETVVTEQRELDRFETTLDHNDSWHHTHDLEPTIIGDNVRIVWLLFPDGEVPDEPSIDDTEYHVHLWVSVDESNGN